MAGYSSTPLAKKLGIKAGFHIHVANEPETYWSALAPLPEKVDAVDRPVAELDLVHWFVSEKKVFERDFKRMKKLIKKDGMLWVSWPKKSSGVVSDLDENRIREFALNNGLVDVKVCAVDDVWSALKLVYRVADRS